MITNTTDRSLETTKELSDQAVQLAEENLLLIGIKPTEASPITLLKARIYAGEQAASAKEIQEKLKAPIDHLRTHPDGIKEDDKKVSFLGSFRGKKGKYTITHVVEEKGKRSVSVENVEKLVLAGIISAEVAKALISVAEPNSYNKVTFKAAARV